MTASRTADLAYAVVIPSLGRASLDRLLQTLAGQDLSAGGHPPREVVIVDDRREPASVEEAAEPLRPGVPDLAG